MTDELPSMEGGSNNQRIFFFSKQSIQIWSQSRNAWDVRREIESYHILFLPLSLEMLSQDNLDSISLEFAPILVSSGGLGLRDYLEQIRKWHPDSRGTQPHSAVQGLGSTGWVCSPFTPQLISWYSAHPGHGTPVLRAPTCLHLVFCGGVGGHACLTERGKIWTNSDIICSPDHIHHLSLAFVCL